MRTRLYDRRDLLTGSPLEVEGYVGGVVLLLDEEMDVELDGSALSRIRQWDDGTLVCDHFGRLNDDESISPYVEPLIRGTPDRSGEERNVLEAYLPGGYSWFPKVRGTGVSPLGRFSISLRRGGTSWEIPILHQGVRTLDEFQAGFGRSVPFQTQGRTLEERIPNRANLRERLQAFGRGVRSVERRFGAELVTSVHVVDRRQIRNAVTCKGETEIWLYVDTLLEEPLEELGTMAAHETLHLLVDREGLTDNTAVRKHFADLKGFDRRSSERSVPVDPGVETDRETTPEGVHTLFFSFIDERNFIEGMKGGHSHQNLDEFCTSFLHSAMFAERLGERLDRPIALTDPGQDRRRLTPEEVRDVLEAYAETARVLKRAAAPGNDPSHRVEPLLRLLEKADSEATSEQARRFRSGHPLAGDPQRPS